MTPARIQRLWFIFSLIIGAGVALGLALFALQQNINLFYTPTQIAAGDVPANHIFRVGGIVVPGSVHHLNQNLAVQFALSDQKHQISVFYNGILPALFREGQGIVVQGQIVHGMFIADQVLAKHDENYRPPVTT